MNERLLQFIWQFQYFNKNELLSTQGESVEIIAAGIINHEQGPDFSNAMVRIAGTTWAGTIELHCRTSDWDRHGHKDDRNYSTVVLHVVWEHDRSINNIAVLELKERVSKIMLTHYDFLMNAVSFIPCEGSLSSIHELTWKSWKERMLIERLSNKAGRVTSYLEQTQFHWEESFWWMLSRNFGLKVNEEAFESMARSIPLSILAKHKNQLQQLEALLFGQSGLLHNKLKDTYARMLQQEYQFLKKKYKLQPIFQPVQFLRMRPGNFPTIRLAQLAVLVSQSAHLFSRIKEAESLQEVAGWFDVAANDYWHYRYRFDQPSPFLIKNLGRSMIDNIMINTVTPVLFAHGNYHNDDKYKLKALNWLAELRPEHNRVTKGFELLGIENKTAFDSQALLELKKEYCDQKRCLDCAVGNAILTVPRF